MEEKLELESKSILAEQLEQLKKIFPEVFCDGKIDFDKLKLVLGEQIYKESTYQDKERFGITWIGKADCYRVIQNTKEATLRPCREESINFDETQNVFIEGENLEVLKILQRSYSGKVKMIYIDPPYNTGKEFIYPDKYKDNIDTYLEYTKQIDERGNKFSTNPESDGRYHSKWLSMMYPRLYLAKSLLKDDGVIFISIDDHEQHRLRMICDEIFGEDNFVADIIRKTKSTTNDNVTGINIQHENCLVYAKNKSLLTLIGEKKTFENYKNPDNDPKGAWVSDNPSARTGSTFPIENPYTKTIDLPPENAFWRFSYKSYQEHVKSGKIKFLESVLVGQRGFIFKRYASEVKSDNHLVPTLFATENCYMNQAATKHINEIFPNVKVFDYTKPINFILKLIEYSTNKNDLILDFFSGSSTTAHAVMKLNAEDGGNRKYIMVQIPETCIENSESFKAGYKTIADIGKERIRRAAKKIKEEYPSYNGDFGFKVFKLDSSNITNFEGNKVTDNESYTEQLEFSIQNIKNDRSDYDILYQFMLRLGFTLTENIKIKSFCNNTKKVFSIDLFSSDTNNITSSEDTNNSSNAKISTTFICLEKFITEELIDEIEKHNPDKVVFLDIGFQNNDALKNNARHSFKNHIFNNKNKSIEFLVF
jgi:adenine-specific DNA-methyltransferase